MIKHRALFIHLAIALAAGSAGWWMSSSRVIAGRELPPESEASEPQQGARGTVHADSPRRSAGKEMGKKRAKSLLVPVPPLESSDVIQANADGSFRVPRSLLHHVNVQPVTGDGELNAAEMQKLGFSPQECEALGATVEEARSGWARREAAQAVRSSRKGQDEILILPPWPGDKAGEKDLELAFREIAGARYHFERRGLEQATQSYVRETPPRMISYRKNEDGSHYYQEIELNPKRMGELGPSPGIEAFRAISSGNSSSTGSVEPSKRYSHLFPEAR